MAWCWQPQNSMRAMKKNWLFGVVFIEDEFLPPIFLWRFWEKTLWGSLFYTTQDDSWKVWEVFFVAHVLRCAPWLRRMPLNCNPIGSMYDIFTYIWLMFISFMVNVGKYTLYGSYGSVFSAFLLDRYHWCVDLDDAYWFYQRLLHQNGQSEHIRQWLICSHWFA